MSFGRDELARSLLQQHMHDCERGRAEDRQERERVATEVAARLEAQNRLSMNMHEQNLSRFAKLESDASGRFLKLMFTLLTFALSAVATFAYEIIKHAN